MTSQQQRLEELQQQAKALAEQIEQLEGQINSARPTSGLLGRWATNHHGKQVLIIADKPVGGWIETAYATADGTTYEQAEDIDDLEFPDQTTRPQDVPVGEAWLVNAEDRTHTRHGVAALKIEKDIWVSRDRLEWIDNEVELITPLIPARPHDVPETVTTEEEYGALPDGSIVAENNVRAFTLNDGKWYAASLSAFSHKRMAGHSRHVLRLGWGEAPR